MPVEHLRKKFAEDMNLYPELSSQRRPPQQAISVGSSNSSSPVSTVPPNARAPPKKTAVKHSTVVISSSDENDVQEEEESSDNSIIISEGKYSNPKPQTARVPSYSQQPRPPAMNGTDDTFIRPAPKPAQAPPPRQPQPQPPSNMFIRPTPKPAPTNHPRPDDTFFKPAVKQSKPPVPVHVPSNRDIAPMPGFLPRPMPSAAQAPARTGGGNDEVVNIPDFRDDTGFMLPAEAEKALRELMGGGMNQELDAEIEIDMTQARVADFKEGIELLPHQVLGRAWMREREDLSRKRTGGILADDMGLGKTIQTLTRIAEGRAKKSDKEEGYSASTLVVCPLALLGQWADEIEKMTNMRVLKHQGASRTTDPDLLKKFHVVVTTYDTVKSEYMVYSPAAKDESKGSSSKASSKKTTSVDTSDDESEEDFGRTIRKPVPTKGKAAAKRCALYGVKWWRIVLDEAHNIKNMKTKGAVACCELQSKFRWCLTGTPMQNNVTELYSLIKFLRIKPLSNWETFNEQIAKPVNSGRGASRAMKRLQVVLKQIMLRRRKDQTLNGKALIDLPKRIVKVVPCEFDHYEQTFYDSLESKMESVIEKLMGSKGNNYISVLLLLLRLRQACNHPILVSADFKKDSEALEPKSVSKGGDDKEADPDDDLVAAFGQMGVTRKCQMCTLEMNSRNMGEGEWNTHCQDCVPLAKQAKQAELERPTSAKIRMILKLLNDIDVRSKGQEKTIIFSQFTSMLDLLEPFLKEKGIRYVRYDGSMNSKDREIALNKIKTSESTHVILISFKAGSTGLNLTACNNVILVDLWWNPALEDQAFDRAHRFGQTRDVNIFKLKIDGTVEDRILLLQEKKRALAAAALSGDKIKNMRLGMDDLLALFRPGGRDDDEESD